LPQGKPKIVKVKEITIAIYQLKGKYFAYLDSCPLQGGPAYECKLLKRSVCEVNETGNRVSPHEDEARPSILCPWHGFDFDLDTGVSSANRKLRLRKYEVVDEGDSIALES
jgi:nitrite reductase/ring-hydroxylating ferredoxin subunit